MSRSAESQRRCPHHAVQCMFFCEKVNYETLTLRPIREGARRKTKAQQDEGASNPRGRRARVAAPRRRDHKTQKRQGSLSGLHKHAAVCAAHRAPRISPMLELRVAGSADGVATVPASRGGPRDAGGGRPEVIIELEADRATELVRPRRDERRLLRSSIWGGQPLSPAPMLGAVASESLSALPPRVGAVEVKSSDPHVSAASLCSDTPYSY